MGKPLLSTWWLSSTSMSNPFDLTCQSVRMFVRTTRKPVSGSLVELHLVSYVQKQLVCFQSRKRRARPCLSGG